jgi:hypothetical protein
MLGAAHCGSIRDGEAAVHGIKAFGRPVLDELGPTTYCELNAALDVGYPRGLISTTTRRVMGKIPFPDATDGVEQPVWDPSTQRFYQAVPETKTEPGGPSRSSIRRRAPATRRISLTLCAPHGLAIGPNREMVVGCSKDKDARSLILSVRTGAVVATITQRSEAPIRSGTTPAITATTWPPATTPAG